MIKGKDLTVIMHLRKFQKITEPSKRNRESAVEYVLSTYGKGIDKGLVERIFDREYPNGI